MERRDAAEGTRLWADALRLPEVISATLARAEEIEATAAFLAGPDVSRIVVTGNGAAFYVAHALWLASLESETARAGLPTVVSMPAGILVDRHFRLGPSDRLLLVSSSGEFRDLVEVVRSNPSLEYAAITSTPESTVGGGAAARVLVPLASQEAVTHTQAFCGNFVAALALWARITEDSPLQAALGQAAERCAESLEMAPDSAEQPDEAVGVSAGLVFGSRVSWAAALEFALLMKEVARIPAEGCETREGATSGMYALGPGHLVLSIAAAGDRFADEAEATCRSTGARVVRIECPPGLDERLASVATFPLTLRLAISLGLSRGFDVDQPTWTNAYYATAR